LKEERTIALGEIENEQNKKIYLLKEEFFNKLHENVDEDSESISSSSDSENE